MRTLSVKDRAVLDALAAAGWSEDDRACASLALRCTASGSSGHWPTTAGWLAAVAHSLARPAEGESS